MVAEPSGGWGPSAHSALRRLAKQAATLDDRPVSFHMSQMWEGLSIVIRRAHARAVLRRCSGVAQEISLPATVACDFV